MRSLIIASLLIIMAVPQMALAQKPLTIAYTDWSSSTSSAYLVKAVLQEKMGRKCKLIPTSAENMWKLVAQGKADAMLSAWLPDTQEVYYKKYGDRVDDLGPNLDGTRIGLVVPKITAGRFTAGTGLRNRPYLTTESIPGLKKDAAKYKNRIVGIDPGAGVMHKANKAIEEYGLDKDFRLVPGSEVSMVAELTHAIRHQRWVVVTGWVPHWIFARWELEFLDDPKDVFGKTGHISTIARKGLKEDDPEAYAFLDSFNWTPGEMGQLMLWIQEDQGLFPYEKALRWIRTHQSEVDSWLPSK